MVHSQLWGDRVEVEGEDPQHVIENDNKENEQAPEHVIPETPSQSTSLSSVIGKLFVDHATHGFMVVNQQRERNTPSPVTIASIQPMVNRFDLLQDSEHEEQVWVQNDMNYFIQKEMQAEKKKNRNSRRLC